MHFSSIQFQLNYSTDNYAYSYLLCLNHHYICQYINIYTSAPERCITKQN